MFMIASLGYKYGPPMIYWQPKGNSPFLWEIETSLDKFKSIFDKLVGNWPDSTHLSISS